MIQAIIGDVEPLVVNGFEDYLKDPDGKQQVQAALDWMFILTLEWFGLPDAQGPEWAALLILVFVIVLFGLMPGIALGPVDTATVPLLNRLGVWQ